MFQEDGVVLGRSESDAPVDRNQELYVNDQPTEVAGLKTAAANEPISRVPTETYPTKSATIEHSTTSEQKTVAVKGSPLLSVQRGEHTAVDDTTLLNVGEKSIKEPIASSVQRPPVMPMPPPQMLPFWTYSKHLGLEEYRPNV
ncbi:hypothetical protein MRX96_035111 [Rhipicephalus microplus]